MNACVPPEMSKRDTERANERNPCVRSRGPLKSKELQSSLFTELKIKRELNWIPKFDDIIKIVSDAYKWELKLKNI